MAITGMEGMQRSCKWDSLGVSIHWVWIWSSTYRAADEPKLSV